MNFYIIFQTLLNSLQLSAIVALSAFAIILIFKTSTTTNFAQGMISVFGAHVTAYLFTMYQVPLLPGFIVGVIVAFGFGILVDTQIIRRSKLATPIGKQMITMGLVLLISGVIPTIFSLNQLYIPTVIPGTWVFSLFGSEFSLTYHSIFSVVLTTIILTVLFIMLKYTKWGLGVRATASNEVVAAMMGVNTRRITAISWSIAGALGATAAILYGATLTFGQSYMTAIQVNGFLAAIVGGFGTFYGPVVGAVLIIVLGNLVGFSASLWQNVIIFGIVLAIALFKPNGLFGKKVIKKV